MNSVKTVLLLGLLSGILLVGGEAIGGTRGLEYGLVMAIGTLSMVSWAEQSWMFSTRSLSIPSLRCGQCRTS